MFLTAEIRRSHRGMLELCSGARWLIWMSPFAGDVLRARVVFICIYFLWLHKVEGNDCSAKSDPNGMTFHLLEDVASCNEYNWCVDNTVVANEDHFNDMMVLSKDRRSITFKTCPNNLTYKNVCNGKIINCPSCPTTPTTNVPSPRNSGHADGVVAVIFVVLFCNLIFML
ncbi:uncharacterized protein LOC108266018 isoform X2 [Ictalurus punctatus]|uniref:Uncharacterized protein LOC108266018 isoform X2 n=1 Tax=Ictalurus punctatus TaxID=7998 RepID=A0A9F7R098_ICTPU|nr:uncharacterized protein LOC108266018 isoform X2 [Ictalurus punctatus]